MQNLQRPSFCRLVTFNIQIENRDTGLEFECFHRIL